jgi:hypothetical protein
VLCGKKLLPSETTGHWLALSVGFIRSATGTQRIRPRRTSTTGIILRNGNLPFCCSLQNAKEPLSLRAGALFFGVDHACLAPRSRLRHGNVSAELSVWHNSITNVCPIGDLLRGGARSTICP